MESSSKPCRENFRGEKRLLNDEIEDGDACRSLGHEGVTDSFLAIPAVRNFSLQLVFGQ